MSEKIIETRICAASGKPFDITEADITMLRMLDPTIAGRKFPLPLPTLSPQARNVRRLSWRNERKLYKGKCHATGRDIISMYSSESPCTVYHYEYWASDAWDPMEYGRDFDFNRPFFEQFAEFFQKIPVPNALHYAANENSEYANYSFSFKDCYMTVWGDYCEDIYYSYASGYSSDCMDMFRASYVTQSYEVVNSDYAHGSKYVVDSSYVRDCAFVWNCLRCENCFLCVNLTDAKYCFRNVQYSKEEYEKKVAETLRTIPLIQLKRELFTFREKSSRPSEYQVGCENCRWTELRESKDCSASDYLWNCSNARHSHNMGWMADSMDLYGSGYESALCYEGFSVWVNSQNLYFSMHVLGSKSLFYSISCKGCQNCFGCSGLRNKQYCVFNKQYTREEYEALVPRIVEHMVQAGEWGEFFPSWMSPFGYNETAAQEYFPLTREEALAKGFGWSDYEPPFPKVEKTIPASKLPENIENIPDDILNWAIECEITKKPFRIIKQELEFYRKHHLPIPRRHPDQRHLERFRYQTFLP